MLLAGGSDVHHQVGFTVRLMGGALPITVATTVSVTGTHLSRNLECDGSRWLWAGTGPAGTKALGWDPEGEQVRRGRPQTRSEMGEGHRSQASRAGVRKWKSTQGAMGNHWYIPGKAVTWSDDGFRRFF